ncbi:unnamed protein product [Oppiella nova]|uniref:Uncharacterized protein n=1 Tax=Oppiella nova TaxID=334625 RepID=A0A7R9M383_9ACAR|nr:unnamed protein product [Oppiella nova]CAG2169889.1 unnamed protein product [Oppiella nova]
MVVVVSANVYHAYHVVHSLGIPDENIILFHYNDLVYNSVNPTPGSMFSNLLPNDMNVYAVTAAGPTESSYFCGHDSIYKTNLGSLFSNFWILNLDTFDLNSQTLDDQYEYIRYKSYKTGSKKQTTESTSRYISKP